MVEVADEQKIYLYVTTPLDTDARKFFLHELEGEEQISGPFHYRLKLKSDDNAIDFTQTVGKKITVTIERYDGSKRYINGVVSRFIQAENEVNFTLYYAEIRPWLWELTLTQDSRIFQNMNVIDIITRVFQDLGFTDFENRTTGSYAQREYCVQYQETAFNFISRLMEDEGIFYFFEHEDGKHTLIMADDSSAHQPCPNLTEATFRQVRAEWQKDDVIDRITFEQQVIPNKYAVDDFNFETPTTDLLTSVDGKETGALRIYEYPGGFTKTNDGQTIADLRMDAHELPQKILRGEGYCRAFIVGYKFDLKEHDRQDLNASYVLRSLSIQANQDLYRNAFEAFPSDVTFRPPIISEKPKISGTQTAIVVGPKGEEIFTDNYGRIKVQFHWDQEGKNDENSSCWIRVAQVWAGKSWGGFILPRIDQEVVVSFLEGDPDRPLVIGCVYNADQVVPYGLPDNQTKSTLKSNSSKGGGGFNEIRFEDDAGNEEIYVHAQKDMNITVENDRTKEVLNNETNTITKSRTTTVQQEDNTLTVEKGDLIINVDTGDEKHTVKGDFVLTVTGDLTIDVTGSVTIKSGLAMTNESGTSMTNTAGTSMTNEASISMTNDGGISLTNKASASQTVDGGGVLTLKGGMVKIN
ncbi:MAG: type VI secretion system tip protein TssI/VgrG [Pseudomonadota bacterium]